MLPKVTKSLRKPKVKKRNTTGEVRQYQRLPNRNGWEETGFALEVLEHEPIYSDALEYYLKGNPYLHTLDSDFEIDNIEQYYCIYKNQYIPMSEVIRSGKYSKFRQRRILRANFKRWKKDYTYGKYETINVIESTFTMIGDVKYNLFGPLKRGLLVLAFLLLVSFVYNQNQLLVRIFGVNTGTNVANSLQTFFLKTPWVKQLFNFSIYAIIGGILYFKLSDTIQGDYERNYRNGRRILENSKTIINRHYRQKTKYARKYYLRKVVRNPDKFAPLKIDKVCQDNTNLQTFKQIANKLILQGGKLKKRQWAHKLSKFILIIISFSGTMFMIVLVIILLIKQALF